MVNIAEFRCPGKQPHKKKIGDTIVSEKECGTLLPFTNYTVEGAEFLVKCTNCKSVIHSIVKDGMINATVMPKGTKVEAVKGKVVVYDA